MTLFMFGGGITFSVPRPNMTFGLGHLFIRQGRCTGSRGRSLGNFSAVGKLGPLLAKQHLRSRGPNTCVGGAATVDTMACSKNNNQPTARGFWQKRAALGFQVPPHDDYADADVPPAEELGGDAPARAPTYRDTE